MPRYDYECQNCLHRFEVRQSFSSDPVATCPVCQNGARRVIHSVPVMFKGSGFYVNDYGKSNNSASGGSETKDSDSDKGAKSEKSDSKSGSDSGAKSEGKKKESTPAD